MGERSIFKSPRSTKDLSLDGESCSRADSMSKRTVASADGGQYTRPQSTMELLRRSLMMRSSILA